MKFIIKSALLGLTGVALFANPAMAAVSLENSGLSIAFYTITGSGPTAAIGPRTYVFNLGQAELYRENTGYNVSVSTVNPSIASSNIGSDLVTAFGSNWASSGTVRWMVVGSNASLGTVGGDPSKTSYYSVGRTTPTLTSFFTSGSGMPISLLNSSGGRINDFKNGTQNVTSPISFPTSNVSGAIVPITALVSVEDFVPPATGALYFNIGTVNLTQTLALNTFNTGLAGALDIHRVIETQAGADLTAGYSSAEAQVRKGQYTTTLLLDTAGNLSVIPEPSAALLGVIGAACVAFRRRRNS